MRVNEKIAIATSRVLLVPYEAHHVLKYHGWMQDPDIQEATASEPMTLEEEYENQQSWRAAHDKLTFIACEPLRLGRAQECGVDVVKAEVEDASDRTRGDINFFLYPDDDEDEDEDEDEAEDGKAMERRLRGEVDVMIAEKGHRGKGMGEGAVRALLTYIRRNLSGILKEYAESEGVGSEHVRLVGLMAKIKEGNVGSRALFKKLGFKQDGGVNYFGEVKMVMDWNDVVEKGEGCWGEAAEAEFEYRELSYEGRLDN